jgi:hypothetical protein
MSCWVVPTIAAEIWGVPVDHLLQRVRDGNLAYRVDEGFMFVDVEPPPAPKVEHPPTFTALSEAELEALRDAEAEEPVRAPEPAVAEVNEDEESQSPADDEASIDLGDWRTARQRIAMTRIPPGRRAKPHAA